MIVEDSDNDILIFAGPRDDPFFFEAVGFNRFRASGDPDAFRGIDSFADFNVSAIVIELPFDLVSDGQDQIGISGFTLRRDARFFTAEDRRLDRTGVPAVSTAFIPFTQRDEFNRALPKDDEDFADVILNTLQNEYGTPDENIAVLASVAIPDLLVIDRTQPDGFPNGRQLEDDVIDALLGLIFPAGPASDGVDENDREFLDSFPYLAPPFQPE